MKKTYHKKTIENKEDFFCKSNRLTSFKLKPTLASKKGNSMQRSKYVKLVVTVPETHADALREALGDADAGHIGNYSHCTFSTKGIGRFKPNERAKPHIGEKNVLEEVEEERIETICHTKELKAILKIIRQVHPYEEPAIDVYPLFAIDS